MHLGYKSNQCHKGNVHGEEMKQTQKEKYLGDQINNKGNIKDTIIERANKGYAIAQRIFAKQVGLLPPETFFKKS